MVWGNKQVVVFGDSRVKEFEQECQGWKPVEIDRFYKPGMKTNEALLKIDKILEENVLKDHTPIDIIVIVGLHCDFTMLRPRKDTDCKIMMPNNPILVDQIKNKLIEWKKTYPYCQIIITVPYIPHIGQYNNSRLYHKLPAHWVKTIYNYGHTLKFTKQMQSIIDDFFQCWTRQLSPKPLALARLENNNMFVQKLRSFRKPVEAYQGSTKDGLHFANNTIKQLWKLL
ncbi:UNVERIFIED_CONTAM: hypothetical protein RMT77_015370 [Armadillidium vulgare]